MIALDNCRVSRPHQSLRNVEMHSIDLLQIKTIIRIKMIMLLYN